MTNDDLKSEVILNTQNQSLSAIPSLLSDNNVQPEDIFATMHYTYAPMVLSALPKLSKKELSRVVEAVVDIPPSPETLKRFNQAQKNIFFSLEKVLMSKYFMMYQVALEQEMKKEQEKQAKEANESSVAVGNDGQTDTTPKE